MFPRWHPLFPRLTRQTRAARRTCPTLKRTGASLHLLFLEGRVCPTIDFTRFAITDGFGHCVTSEQELVAAYAPVLRMDAEEPFLPEDVSIFMRDSRLVRSFLDTEVLAELDNTWLTQLNGPAYSGSDNYIDLPATTADAGRLTYLNIADEYTNTIYATVTESPASDQLAVEYWFPYYQTALSRIFFESMTRQPG